MCVYVCVQPSFSCLLPVKWCRTVWFLPFLAAVTTKESNAAKITNGANYDACDMLCSLACGESAWFWFQPAWMSTVSGFTTAVSFAKNVYVQETESSTWGPSLRLNLTFDLGRMYHKFSARAGSNRFFLKAQPIINWNFPRMQIHSNLLPLKKSPPPKKMVPFVWFVASLIPEHRVHTVLIPWCHFLLPFKSQYGDQNQASS